MPGHAATKHHIDRHARIGKQLSGEAYVLLVPSCVVEELESIGEPVAAALEFARNQCDLLEAPKHDASQTCADVIKALVGAKHSGNTGLDVDDLASKREARAPLLPHHPANRGTREGSRRRLASCGGGRRARPPYPP